MVAVVRTGICMFDWGPFHARSSDRDRDLVSFSASSERNINTNVLASQPELVRPFHPRTLAALEDPVSVFLYPMFCISRPLFSLTSIYFSNITISPFLQQYTQSMTRMPCIELWHCVASCPHSPRVFLYLLSTTSLHSSSLCHISPFTFLLTYRHFTFVHILELRLHPHCH